MVKSRVGLLRGVAVACASMLGCAASEDVGEAREAVTLTGLGAEPAPLVLPRGLFNERFRVSQRGNDSPSHDAPSTLEATDWPGGGTAVAPLAGTVRIFPCGADTGLACNRGWGNTVELNALRGGERYIFGHCARFLVANDAFVVPGAALCEIGTTGNSTAVHLHFDRVTGDIPGYRSVGAKYLTRAGTGALSVLGGRNFRTCCSSGCDAATGTSGCVTYASYVTPLASTAGVFVAEHTAPGLAITGAVGAAEPVREMSDATWTVMRQRVNTLSGGRVAMMDVYVWHGSLAGNGSRNPFTETAYTLLWNTSEGRAVGTMLDHVRTLSTDGITFDLWDTLRALAPSDVRASVAPPASYNTWSAWTPDFDLYGADITAGGRSWPVFVAVLRAMRGRRYGIVLMPTGWSQWVSL